MAETRVKYLPNKQKKAQIVLAKQFDAVRGMSKSSNEELSSEDDDADATAGHIAEKPDERFHTAECQSEK